MRFIHRTKGVCTQKKLYYNQHCLCYFYLYPSRVIRIRHLIGDSDLYSDLLVEDSDLPVGDSDLPFGDSTTTLAVIDRV